MSLTLQRTVVYLKAVLSLKGCLVQVRFKEEEQPDRIAEAFKLLISISQDNRLSRHTEFYTLRISNFCR